MSALDTLQQSLTAVNARLLGGAFGEPKAMGRTADHFEKRYGDGRAPDTDIVLKTLKRFVEHGGLKVYKDIRNACYGIMVPYQSGRTLVSNKDVFEVLLKIVDGFHADPRKLKRCFQALMGAYLELDGCDARSPLHEQWISLRCRLERWLPQLATVTPKPDWLAGAIEHRNLFGSAPTDRYGAAVLRGDTSVFDDACTTLGIGRTSWVRRRVVISAIDAAVSEVDAIFRTHLDSLIELLGRNDGVRDEGAAKLLNRYVRQSSTPEHIALRAFAIDVFGNPLINANRQRWYEVSDEAREMVANWLKGFLIERFFELLSHDGRTDKRRPRFWLKHRASIENMWFILGSSAMSSWNEDFKKVRETMGNQCLPLEGATAGNNAFVMRLGKVYVVEFGERGNATYVFNQNAVPFELTSKYLCLNQLKGNNHVKRLLHKDGLEQWESKFAETLSAYGVYADDPTQMRASPRQTVSTHATGGVFAPPNFRQLFKQFCNERGLRYDDRAPSGRLVVYTDSSNGVISGTLGQWGFTYERTHARWVKNG
ncbi:MULTISPECIES: EH signature domain-containing protein [Hydrocarboniphaga]|uniref:EH signature domain-containing protein n=1 Tax=Hydrocarboniphaga TaxID=243627 RepID=UPI002AB9CBC4|nr:EH signature domain-containing protein [Hydrocarboniphaga sp.]MDZ4078512.1 EH signature domain-containing protein [Hydrocarboniphaga sp.]